MGCLVSYRPLAFKPTDGRDSSLDSRHRSWMNCGRRMRVTYLSRCPVQVSEAVKSEVQNATGSRDHDDKQYTRDHADQIFRGSAKASARSAARRLRVDVPLQPVADGVVQAGEVHAREGEDTSVRPGTRAEFVDDVVSRRSRAARKECPARRADADETIADGHPAREGAGRRARNRVARDGHAERPRRRRHLERGLVAADDGPDVLEARRREARDCARQGLPLLGGPAFRRRRQIVGSAARGR